MFIRPVPRGTTTIPGAELAATQIGPGADVVLLLAGGTGIGILHVTADAGKLGIVSDANQNGLHPESVLTSMVKHVDATAFEAFAAARDGDWKRGILSLGLAEGGVDWTLDDFNRDLITPAMKDAADAARNDIINGRFTVHDYMQDGTCPR
ncbi:BMP family protein [Thalassospira sp. MCCC 1A03138]|uniref:BMP family lipoprotein n=1 Tax=Thalassospira sp. MCCC 1A03138 TaxID=1470576 RepID=UPI001AEFBA82|nr:BMP family ABC transporter substrate-binding protein [Thalassospira sp. MCCC 1A03138]